MITQNMEFITPRIRQLNPGQVNYSSAKAGLSGFTKSLAKEVGSRGITVNSVAPGFIETDMTSFLDCDAKNEIVKEIPTVDPNIVFEHTADMQHNWHVEV